MTRILDAIQHGDSKAADELLPLVYVGDGDPGWQHKLVSANSLRHRQACPFTAELAPVRVSPN